jgi:hypothetical protein
MIKKAEILMALFVVLGLWTGSLRAEIVSLNLFDLGCQEFYDFNSSSWTTNFDLGITFTEISNIYVDWSGEITGGLAVKMGSEPFPIDVGINASLGFNPYRHALVRGGETTYPDAETFDLLSEVESAVPSTWSDLLDGQGTITVEYTEIIITFGQYVVHGNVVLSSATIIVDGVPVPEPAAILFLTLGSLLLTRRRR